MIYSTQHCLTFPATFKKLEGLNVKTVKAS